ncbi:hypothetical protein HGA34_02595 [Candidatus Falkowbacteria bacterium]|nr:hypothetical protein [Candidatus Falkowbacteria bacterium]
MNIFPGSFDPVDDQSGLAWKKIGNAFVNDLSENADLGEYNQDNSALIMSSMTGLGSSVDTPVPTSSAPVESAEPQEVPSAEPEAAPDGGQQPASETEAPSLEKEKTGEEISEPEAALPTEQVESAVEPPASAEPLSRLIKGFFGSLLPDFFSGLEDAGVSVTALAANFSKLDTASAQDVEEVTVPGVAATSTPDATPPAMAYAAHDMILKDFSLPDGFSSSTIANVQLRLSLAAQSSVEEDRLKIYYTLDENWEEMGLLDLGDQLSNQSNNGYFLFGLPIFESWEKLGKLRIKVSYLEARTGDEQRTVEAFIDGAWLEVDYDGTDKASIKSDPGQDDEAAAKNSDEFTLDLISGKDNFKTADNPEFNFLYQRKQGFIGKTISEVLGTFWDQYGGIEIEAAIIDAGGKRTPVETSLDYLADGEFRIRLKNQMRYVRPGKYSIELKISDGDKSYVQTQDFSWGVLAINASKSVYVPGETAFLQMAALDDFGNTICDADLFLEVTAPDGGVAYLNTGNDLVVRNSACGPNNVIDTPDYFAHYGVGGAGVYQLKLIARTPNGNKEITDSFEVRDAVPFDVERVGPTRIYPLADYKMRINIRANEDYAGDISEVVPGPFKIVSQELLLNGSPLGQGGRLDVTNDGHDGSVMTWRNIRLKQYDSLSIVYEFDAPDISPEFYLLGPLSIGNFTEARKWQIASDAVSVVLATAGSGVNWTNAANAWNGTNNTYASRDIPQGGANDSANYLKATANSATDLGGTITQVEIGVEGYVERTTVSAWLRPLLNGTATGTPQQIPGTTLTTADTGATFYVDITSASSSWTWANIQNLDVLVHGSSSAAQNRFLYIDQISIRVTYTPPNSVPTGLINSAIQKTDGSGKVDFAFNVSDADGDTSKAKIEYVAGSNCDFASPGDPTIDAATTATFGAPVVDNSSAYQVGTTTGWILTASGTNTVNVDWNSKTDIPTGDGVYCMRLTANDKSDDQTSPATTTVTIDNMAPTAPGQLAATTSPAGNGALLSFGATSTDSNFSEYKIYYKVGSSGVTENDQVFDKDLDGDLDYANYNSATSTTIDDLAPLTTYVFSIWAYDQYGNKSSSSEVTLTTGKAAPLRANSVIFLAGQYSSSDGATGQQSDTDQTLPAFDFKLAETGAKIKNAYLVFEGHFESYANNAGSYTSHKLAFDACQQPCTANAFTGTGNISLTDSTVLAYDETGSNQVRLVLDVTNEAQLAAYSGNGSLLSGQVGYSINRGTAINSISAAKATLAVTYQYDEDDTDSYTNTVVYPLESTVAGDQGTRRAVQADDCTVDSTCPIFAYNMDIPEFGEKLSQWFQTYNQNDGNSTADMNSNVNIQGTNFDSNTYVHESALGGTQGGSPVIYFYDVNGYAESTAQQLEYHATSPGATLTYYLLGGEVVETYVASTSAATKTRTAVIPVGVVNNGLTTTKTGATSTMYFPENGQSTGVVSIKKAWFRIITNNYNTAANTVTVSTKVGTRAETAGSVYNYNQAGTSIKPSFNIIHVIPSADYAELQSANATTPKAVSVYTQNSIGTSHGGTSVELVITYSYTTEVFGHLSSLSLTAGQTNVNGNSQNATTSVARFFAPEAPNSKTLISGGLLASYLLSASNGTMPGAGLTIDANISTGTPTCTNAYNSRPDSVNAFTEFYKDVTSRLSVTNNQRYIACYSNDGGANATAGGKMNGILRYVYRYDAPPVQYRQGDWRWYDNANSLAPGPARGGEKATTTGVNLSDVVRLRLNVGSLAETAVTSSQSFRLQYGLGSNCSAIVSWSDVGTTTSASPWRSYNNTNVADGSSTASALLSTSNKFETYEEDNPTSLNPQGLDEGEYGEWDWVLYNNSATSSSDYCFRMTKSDGTILTDYGSYPVLTTAASNTAPNLPDNLIQYLGAAGTTTIANQAWINQTTIRLLSDATDVNINESIGLYYELITDGTAFRSSTVRPTSTCAYGTTFAACASKVWAATSTLGDYRYSAFVATTSITALPQDYNGYKWQVIACDDSAACSLWNKYGPNPNFRIDLTAPTAPGSLTLNSRSVTSITLNFGASTTEANFDRYRIYYKKATTTVSESDTQHSDSDLDYINYNGTATTTVTSLTAGSTYVFNIWAYDLAGNKTSSTQVLVASTTSSFTPPSGSIITTAQKTDGSGAIDFTISAQDPDNDDTLRAKIDYVAGVGCDFSSPSKATIDTADANTTATYGDPKVDQAATYQVGTTSGWIVTSLGNNFVLFDWLSKSDIPNINATYCVRLTINDGLFDQATSSTKLILIDNIDPANPGNLSQISKNHNSVRLGFGAPSSDTNFYRYRLFYSTSSPVTEAGSEQADGNLNNVGYNGATTTLVTGLLPDTQYYFKIWAYDDYGNKASSSQLAIRTNAYPYSLAVGGQTQSNNSAIANGAWTPENQIKLFGSAKDPDTSEVLTLYFEFLPNASSFKTATTVPVGACAYGTAYNSCASKIWFVSSSSPADYSVNPFSATTSITGIPDSVSGYKWQVLACDDDGSCTSWQIFNAVTPNVKVDTTPPTAPGALTFNSKTSTEVTLAFGSSTSETNFSQYRIFYSTSTPVTATSSEQTDANLDFINYNGATLTTVPNLSPNTQYYFNIWAYDLAGLYATSTEVAVTTNPTVSTPGVYFYTKNTRVLFYRVWSGISWGAEQSGPTLGSAAGDNIRHIDSIRSDDGGKVAVLVKTWDGTNQEWWGTVYRVAANNFATSSILGAAQNNATTNNLITGCMGSLSSGEFFVVRNNNAANGTLVYSWSATGGWVAEGAGPNPVAVLTGCQLTRRPSSDNYLLTTFDNAVDLGSAYYTGTSTYSNSWTTWNEHSTNENNVNNFVGESFFDPGDNTRGAINYSNSAVNTYTNAKNFLADGSSISYGSASTSPQTAPDNWGGAFVQGKFSADFGSIGLAYFAGRDASDQLNVYKVDITNGTPDWSTVTNGDNISTSTLYNETNFAQMPFDIAFYKYYRGVVVWNAAASTTPKYRILNSTTNTIDAVNTAVQGATSSVWTRVKLYKDPNEIELLAAFQSTNINYGAVFFNGAANQFYSAGNQAWLNVATNTGAFSANDAAVSFTYTAGNSAPNTPTALLQQRSDASTTIANGNWTNQNQVYVGASAIDPDTSEVITLYTQLVANASAFATSTALPSGACVWGTAYGSCASKIWFVASSSPGDYSVTPYSNKVNITGLPDSATGYKWQVIACDDSLSTTTACSNWVAFNSTQPNFKVDTTAPTAPGALTIASKNSNSVTLRLGATTTESNFSSYRIYYKAGASGATEADTLQSDANLGFINYNGATTSLVINLASTTQYVFNIWAYDLAGNKATATPEVSTTTSVGPIMAQTSYIFENDDGANVNSNSSAAAASTSLANLNKGERFDARIQIENRGGDVASNKVYKLQFENQTDAPGTWADVSNNSGIAYGLGISGNDGDAVTSAKASANANAWVNGTWHEGTNLTSAKTLANGQYTELVFALRTNNALTGKTYRLRLYNSTDNKVLEVYNNYPAVSIVASETVRHSKGNYPSLPTGTTDLTYYLDPKGYGDVAADDNSNRDPLTVTAQYPIFYFVTKNSTNTQAITATWNGQSSISSVGSNMYLQVYRFGTTNAWVTVDLETTFSANTDFTMTASLNSRLSEYYDGSNWTYWRVYQDAGTETLRTDYFNATFSAPVADTWQKHYRWRSNFGNETTAFWLEAEDVGSPTASTSLQKNVTTRLRLSAANTGGGAANQQYQIQYATTTGNCASDPGGWATIPTSTTLAFRMSTTTTINNGSSTTQQLANAEGYTFVPGRLVKDPSNKATTTTLAESRYTEIEFAFFATNNAVDNTTYCFRMTDNGTPLNHYDRYAELTVNPNANAAPTFVVDPSDNGSATNTPTNFGGQIAFAATGEDTDNDSYYLAICQTNSVAPGNDAPPTCGGGSWCISSLASSTQEATCSYTAATSSESSAWYGFACDKKAGVGVGRCSTVSQGNWGNEDDSPFAINHPPTFTSVSTLVDNQNPGSSFTITTVSQDTDSLGGADTLSLFVCSTSTATFSGCAGGAGNTVCSAVATSSPNARCSFTDVAPTPAGPKTYYGFLFDNHDMAAAANYRTNTYTINNVSPVLGSLVLNSSTNITLNSKGAGDKSVSTINTSIVDQNGCATGLVSATAVIYMSNATNGSNCTANDNDCYQITTGNCVKSDCTDDNDTTATYTCTAGFKHFAIPTDDGATGNPWQPYNWLSRLQVYDGVNYAATSSPGVEVLASQVLDVSESAIDYGNNLFAGDDTGTSSRATTVINYGNSPINTDLSGTDMVGAPTGTLAVTQQKWSLTQNFNYPVGTSLTNVDQTVNVNLLKPTTTADVSKKIYWGIGIPFGAESSAYTGSNIFTAILDALNW